MLPIPAADIKNAYVGRGMGWFEDVENPFSPDVEPVMHPEKGGMILTENITYNCLAGDLSAVEESLWKCPICQVDVMYIVHISCNDHCST